MVKNIMYIQLKKKLIFNDFIKKKYNNRACLVSLPYKFS